jgi:hypothetical protein
MIARRGAFDPTPARGDLAANAALVLLLLGAFIGRSAISSDGGEILSVSLAFLVQGRFEAAMLPSSDLLQAPALHSHYGLFPSLLALPFLAPVWPFRSLLGASAIEAAAALTWLAGAALAALGFRRVVRSLHPGASAWWAPAFLAGTFLWPYAGDSFFEPWSSGALAFAAVLLLSPAPLRPSALAAAGILWSAGCWLRPILWVTAPVPVLAAALRLRQEGGPARVILPLALGLSGGLATALLVNRIYQGAFLDFGYVLSPGLPFHSSLASGLLGQTVFPERGVLVYAPLVVVGLTQLRRLRAHEVTLFAGPFLVLLLVISRWYIWYGGSCWGPRYLLAILPLAAAPAVLLTRRTWVPLVLAGGIVNLLGVIVAPGVWISYAEKLPAPAKASWPAAGPDRVSEVATLSPVYGHAWLLAENLRPGMLPALWISKGPAAPPVPKPEEFVSPWILRRVLGLSTLRPIIPRLLIRTAAGYVYRDRPEQAVRFARAALELDPHQSEAREIIKCGGRLADSSPKTSPPDRTESPQAPGSASRSISDR